MLVALAGDDDAFAASMPLAASAETQVSMSRLPLGG